MIPIKNSPLASYFDDVHQSADDLDNLCMLDAAESAAAWSSHFDVRAKGLYDLPDDSWVVRHQWISVGTWIEAYNGRSDAREIARTVEKGSSWRSDEPLLLFRDSRNIVSLTFEQFSRHWQDLFAAFDDGPILISRGGSKTAAAFRFVPLGQILQTSLD